MMRAQDIEAEHGRIGSGLGWRFLMCPEQLLSTAKVAVIALNPGGRRRHGPDWSSEAGNAYWTESWSGQPAGADPLQRQVQRLAQVQGLGSDEILCAQFVPFRSNSWTDLPNRPQAIAFAKTLWSWALPLSPADTFICLGKKVVGPGIAELVGASLSEVISAGWGDQTIEVYRSANGKRVIALPHLGRFKLMRRAVSEAAVQRALA